MDRDVRSCDRIRPDLALYARGLLPQPESDVIRGHIEACPACAADAAFSFELEQALRLSSTESSEPALDAEFTRRVMRAVATGPVLRLKPHGAPRRAWGTLAAAAGLLAVVSLAFRAERPRTWLVDPSRATVVPSTNDSGQPQLLAHLKAALAVCGQPTSARGQVGWSSDREAFPDLSDAGTGSTPRTDAFFLNDPYAALFTDVLPSYSAAGS